MYEIHNQQVRNAVDVLNRIHSKDPSVLPALITYRVPCNEELAADETVQVGQLNAGEEAKWEVGFLGILNGIFGINDKGRGYIYAHFDDEKNLTHFSTSLEE